MEPSILTNTIENFELNPFQPSISSHIETSHLFCRVKQMSGLYMKGKTRIKLVKDQFLKRSQGSRNPSEKSTKALDLHLHVLAWIKNRIGHLTT